MDQRRFTLWYELGEGTLADTSELGWLSFESGSHQRERVRIGFLGSELVMSRKIWCQTILWAHYPLLYP